MGLGKLFKTEEKGIITLMSNKKGRPSQVGLSNILAKNPLGYFNPQQLEAVTNIHAVITRCLPGLLVTTT